MATANKLNAFVEHLAEKVHNLGADTLKIMLTNTLPVAANSIRGDLTEISAGSGYSAGGATVTTSTSAQTAGLYTLVLADVVFTASGGSIGPFRYVVLYNDTPTSPADPLIEWWDYGSAVTLADGETFTVDFSPSNGALQLQ